MERTYTYHGYTRSICNSCNQLLDCKIIIEAGKVFTLKRCPDHGIQKNLLESDAAYYLARHAFDKPGTQTTVQTATEKGCPFDCGLCETHDQHTCIGLMEITTRCNMNCPICYAHCDDAQDLTLTQIEAMMDFYQTSELNDAEILQISGGEPTLHPEILQILDLAMSKGFKYVMLNTNGLALLENTVLLEKISQFKTGFEVYLQFDGFNPSNNMALRGHNPTAEKLEILEVLQKNHIPTTLVVTVEEKTNLKSLGPIIQYAMDAPMVRGINFQPLAYYDPEYPAPLDRITLTEVLTEIEEQTSGMIKKSDFIPLPCNVERIAINYMIKEKGTFTPVTRRINLRDMVPEIKNTLSFKLEDADVAGAMCSCMKGLPKLTKLVPKGLLKATVQERVKFIDTSTFRLTVSAFIDRYNFDMKSVQKECVHVITPDLKRIPFSTYNMIHRSRGK